jgi:hypothetical protein
VPASSSIAVPDVPAESSNTLSTPTKTRKPTQAPGAPLKARKPAQSSEPNQASEEDPTPRGAKRPRSSSDASEGSSSVKTAEVSLESLTLAQLRTKLNSKQAQLTKANTKV